MQGKKCILRPKKTYFSVFTKVSNVIVEREIYKRQKKIFFNLIKNFIETLKWT
jgi:hypothetical protein